MKQYSIFQAPILSFFSKDLYRDVGLHWKGTGFVYLLLLLTLCSIPGIIQFHFSVTNYIDNKAPSIISQVPRITIVRGEASTDVSHPHSIMDPDSGKVLVLIDTTGETTSLAGTEAKVLVTKTEAIIKKSEIETRTFSFTMVDYFAVDQQRVAGWFRTFRTYAAVVLLPFAVFGLFILRIMELLIYAAIGLLFAAWCKTKLSYKSLLRLSAMAVTPGIIASTVLIIIDVKVPFANLLYFLVPMGYLFLGVKATGEGSELNMVADEREMLLKMENRNLTKEEHKPPSLSLFITIPLAIVLMLFALMLSVSVFLGSGPMPPGSIFGTVCVIFVLIFLVIYLITGKNLCFKIRRDVLRCLGGIVGLIISIILLIRGVDKILFFLVPFLIFWIYYTYITIKNVIAQRPDSKGIRAK